MEEILKTLPQYTMCRSNVKVTLYKYQGFWNTQDFLEGGILAQEEFKAEPSNVFICSCPKTGTTWVKALAYAIVTRDKFNESNSPLLTTMPHDCVPVLEKDLEQIIQENQGLVATHLPYVSLPESVLVSNCKIVYIYRNIKDVIVSYFHFVRDALKLPDNDDDKFDETFDEFCQGVSWYGPYWDHILGYWRASIERPGRVLFLKYEDLKSDATSNVKRLADFIGYPFSLEEENAGVVENIIKLCSFENLSNLEVNKTGKHRSKDGHGGLDNRIYFRKAKDGDWENYFTDEMKEKIDKLVDEKMIGTGLVLK